MKMTIEFDCDNDAFTDFGDLSVEVDRVLMRVIMDVDQGRQAGTLMDVNGNTIGAWTLQ